MVMLHTCRNRLGAEAFLLLTRSRRAILKVAGHLADADDVLRPNVRLAAAIPRMLIPGSTLISAVTSGRTAPGALPKISSRTTSATPKPARSAFRVPGRRPGHLVQPAAVLGLHSRVADRGGRVVEPGGGRTRRGLRLDVELHRLAERPRADNWNKHPRPFAWTNDAGEIQASIKRTKSKDNALTDR